MAEKTKIQKLPAEIQAALETVATTSVAMKKAGTIKDKAAAILKSWMMDNKMYDIVFGDYRAKLTIPDTSKYDPDKVFAYLKKQIKAGKIDTDEAKSCLITKITLDDDALTALVNAGKIDIDELMKAAWVEGTGSPTLRPSIKSK